MFDELTLVGDDDELHETSSGHSTAADKCRDFFTFFNDFTFLVLVVSFLLGVLRLGERLGDDLSNDLDDLELKTSGSSLFSATVGSVFDYKLFLSNKHTRQI